MTKTILILAANPKNTSRLRLDQEVREIDNGLQRSKRRDEFIFKQVWAVRHSDFRRAMLDLKPNIVHFCGHGSAAEGIAFEDENGLAKFMSTEALAGFFELFADEVECVVLNACYSESQAKAISEHVPHVIGMNKAIGDATAIEFSVAFYDAVGAGKSIEFAYKLACNAIHMADLPEQLTPQLKTRNSKHHLVNSGDDNIELSGTWELTDNYEFGTAIGMLQLVQIGHLLSGTITIRDLLDDGEELIFQEEILGSVQSRNISLNGIRITRIKGDLSDYEFDKWTGVIENNNLITGFSDDGDGTSGTFTIKRLSASN